MPFEEFFCGRWFPDKGSESAKARVLNHMNLNTRHIEVVHIGFCVCIIFDFTSEGRGSKIDVRKMIIFGALFFLKEITHRS